MPRFTMTLLLAFTGLLVLPASAATYTIDIGGPLDALFVRQGWYAPEGPYPQFGPIWHHTKGRWASQGATVRLPVFPGVDNIIELRGEIGSGDRQSLRCSVDGTPLAELPHNPDLLYRFTVPADRITRPWAVLKLETTPDLPRTGADTRDLRVAVDWITVTADAPIRNFLQEALAESAELDHIAADQPPARWRCRYDPNNIGSAFAPDPFDRLAYDDSAWAEVSLHHAPPMRRGEVMWYRGWVHVTEQGIADLQKGFLLPGQVYEPGGRREAWVNGVQVKVLPDKPPLGIMAVRTMQPGYNLIVVKAMQGPLPAVGGADLVEPEVLNGRWNPSQRLYHPGPIILRPEHADARSVHVRLLDAAGRIIREQSCEVRDLGDGRRGVPAPAAPDWPIATWGQHRLIVTDDEGYQQSFPLQFLGLHLFHWGWYSAANGTEWRGFQPTSNDYIDQLLARLSDWGRPHHSITWGGAILAPGTGFHRTAKTNYINLFKEAVAAGRLEFVGAPFPPRNICTDLGESLIRSLRWSRKNYQEQLGITPHVFISHDSTMTPRLPQIMQMCGYDTYCVAENWWGQGQSIPNSRDCHFADADGTQVRILDSGYHGISPIIAARRAAEQGKPAVLCNEEFACLDATVFLEPSHLDTLAAEGIFLSPVSLADYTRITAAFADELTYRGDDALCYKGWTGGGPEEIAYEKANRDLEHHLTALENLVAWARTLGIEVDQHGIDERWDLSLRSHECHYHWGNGFPDTTRRLTEAAAWSRAQLAELAGRITGTTGSGSQGIVVYNPLGLPRGGLVHIPAPTDAKSLCTPDGKLLPLQPDPEQPGRALASVPPIPSIGRMSLAFSTQTGKSSDAQIDPATWTLSNGLLRVQVTPEGGLTRVQVGDTVVLTEPANTLLLARPQAKAPTTPVSRPSDPLDFAHYAGLIADGNPRIIADGPVLAAIECTAHPIDYPEVTVHTRIMLAAGETQVRVRLALEFAQPTVLLPRDGPGPHEGVYLPGAFLAFPFPPGASPRVDMAYTTTDHVLSSTNHATFLKVPFRSTTFNLLSMVGPSTGSWALLTRGLHDAFVKTRNGQVLGLSLGVGPENAPYAGTHVHEYALFIPTADGSDPAAQAYQAAQAFQVDLIAVETAADARPSPSTDALISLEPGQGSSATPAMIAGIERDPATDVIRCRLINLSTDATAVRVRSALPLTQAEILPAGQLHNEHLLTLPARAIRELIIPPSAASP